MKLLILGNHTCGNRGDSAIMRGLLDAIRQQAPEAEMDVMSRFPVSSAWLQGRPIIADPLYQLSQKQQAAAGLNGRVKKVLRRRFQHKILLPKVAQEGSLRNFAIAPEFAEFAQFIAQYDAVIQVGGSNYVDLYGLTHFEYPLCAFMANKPIYMVGHSVGPFQNPDFNQLANYVFGRTSALILRETVSRDMMTAAQIDTRKVEQGVDTAWLIERRHDEFVASYAVQHWLDVTARRKTVAITLRDLEPFDKRLGTTQQAYEQAFAQVVNRLIADGYQVLALSTCTSIDRYNRDDRMVALRMAKYVNDSENFHIAMDELNDVEIGKILASCVLTIGTRLHSAIISMNFGTPAIAINYEHKSAGIMQQLGLAELAIDIRHLLNGSLQSVVADTLNQLPALKAKVANAVTEERAKGFTMIKSVLDRIREAQ
ncbi:TPA: colanic acid biosynthesis pyruvyl transferase WcaK [Salmonella enterica subsp. enterica serovar Gallinarum]|nr:colanic acid biosynthesis pyruvyl transferase WcaK [Salmonella enterica]ELR5725954.1 colanic acid biosynthesis pyruvyl transferase WcaK [Salmonella enterica]ELR5734382.1 colanic acid biosynthesis pyruvyl transferase WcaK [Salmonella enterica]ELR5868301.1 colanic acid biosynthesis pyruvyl transferase WcaK [Salmonella enterica]